MVKQRDQLPGLISPPSEWTAWQMIGGMLLAALVLLPWAFLYVILWALLSTD